MAKTITVIPPTRDIFTTAPIAVAARRRVAGYARVSTDSDEQFTSYEAQIDYYTTFIKSKPEWDFVRVYTDEGISATNTLHRDGFNEMIADALAGKIDLMCCMKVTWFICQSRVSASLRLNMKPRMRKCAKYKTGLRSRALLRELQTMSSYQQMVLPT